MKRISKLMAGLLALSASGILPAKATVLPSYAGSWDCGVGVFTFTRNTYDAGEGPLTAQRVDVEDGSYHFIFEDGYSFWVSVNGREMQWLSDASGDSFTCSRVTN